MWRFSVTQTHVVATQMAKEHLDPENTFNVKPSRLVIGRGQVRERKNVVKNEGLTLATRKGETAFERDGKDTRMGLEVRWAIHHSL